MMVKTRRLNDIVHEQQREIEQLATSKPPGAERHGFSEFL